MPQFYFFYFSFVTDKQRFDAFFWSDTKKSQQNTDWYFLRLFIEIRVKMRKSCLNVVQVDDSSCDVGQQADEILLVLTDPVWYLVKDDLDPLVVSEDVDVHIGGCTVAGEVTS